ncbi:MAG: hypothetical protein QW531_00550 [Thermoplasmata archaeon]
MKDIFDSQIIIGLSARNMLTILSGLLLLLSPFLLWTVFYNSGSEQKLDGFDLQRMANAFTLLLIPLCGLAAMVGSFVCSRFPELLGSRIRLGLGLSIALLAILSLLLTTFQADLWMSSRAGSSFLNNVSLGWYAALTGSLLLVFSLLVPKQKKLFPERE